MPTKMKSFTAFSLVMTFAFIALYMSLKADILYTLSITFGTISYHFVFRLIVGAFVNAVCKEPNCQNAWFRQKAFEPALYNFLRVMRWKRHLPTYNPDSYDPSLHTWDEIIKTMCRSELVHEINVVLSFLPMLTVRWFGSFTAFLITSVLAAAFDLLFVIVQRYNRPRVIKLAQRRRA